MTSREYPQVLLLLLMYSGISFADHCGPSMFQCDNGQCIPDHNKCDYIYQCDDLSDENHCSIGVNNHGCQDNWFKCDNGHCIEAHLVCNQDNDCLDHSDEKLERCNKTTEKDHKKVCGPDWFSCDTGDECIHSFFICDNDNDCTDGSDELHCNEENCPELFVCQNKHCIPPTFHCDGIDDCHDNSDEENCESKIHPVNSCYSQEGLFLCNDGTKCLEMKNVCNGSPDCLDKSDEEECNMNIHLNLTYCKVKGCTHDCHAKPKNQIGCLCPSGFKLDVDERTCVDTDECQIFGSCHQRCKNTVGSFECFCDDEYDLQPDGRSCKAKGGEALILFASGHKIRGIYLNSEVYFTVREKLSKVIGVSHNGRHVFWTEIAEGNEAIYKCQEDGSETEVIVNSGLGLAEDLAVDYVTGNIYFTDAQEMHIGVCTESGSYCTVLHNQNVHKPRALALYSQKGILFWSDWGKTPMIATSGMDGSNPRPLISEKIEWPNGLTLDISNDRLYWVDAKKLKIESSKLDGSDRRIILEDVIRHPFSIAVFENTLYWSDWEGTQIEQCNKFTGKNYSSLVKEKNSNEIHGVHIYHPALHPKVHNPCEDLPCSHICLLGPGIKYTCACPEGFNLGLSLHTCSRKGKEVQVVVGGGQQLLLTSPQYLGKQEVAELSLHDVETVGPMTYDSLTESVIISDDSRRIIYRYHLQHKHAAVLIHSGLGKVVSMSFDSYGNNLYLCDSERKSVEVWSLNGPTRHHLTIFKAPEESTPLSIVVVPEKGVLFVAILNASESVILSRISMDGTSVKPVLEAFGRDINLAYDKYTERVYWCDSDNEIIESMKADGTDRRIAHVLLGHHLSIAIRNNILFWTKENYPSLFWNHLSVEGMDKISFDRYVRLDVPKKTHLSLLAIDDEIQISHHPCRSNMGGCSHLCLVSANSQRVCRCPLGTHLSHDNRTCLRPIHCSDTQFHCRKDDQCIQRGQRCDGQNDCPSGEDEEDCAYDNCSEHQFKCNNNQCIAEHKRCDHKNDCFDRSDEKDCVDNCDVHKEFHCGSGECIPIMFKCDNKLDCADQSDEIVCDSTCGPEMFRCGSGTCIPTTWECDGDSDCIDDSDEHDGCATTTAPQCRLDEINCGDGQCVHHRQVCNDINDCADGRDEEGCSNCGPNKFQCKNMRCIFEQWVCDNADDCGDNSDEEKQLCLGRPGKINGHGPCQEFECGSKECIPYTLTCDGFHNCEDGSDEAENCESACSRSTCQQTCKPTPAGAICGCKEGYKLNGDGQTCSDVDECAEGKCSQICKNTPGSFECGCVGDYMIRNDRLTCKATGKPMEFVLSGENQIEIFSHEHQNTTTLLYEPRSQISGLDVDARHGRLYWSSVGLVGKINVLDISGHKTFIGDMGQPGKLSFDWITGNVFFIDNAKPNKIMVCHMDEKACACILTVNGSYSLSQIVVDPISGLLFYSQVSDSFFERPSSKIYRFSFADQNITLLAGSNINYVSGIVVDHIRQNIYWSDHYQKVIEKVSFNGGDRQVVFKSQTYRPGSLTLFEDSLYWLDRKSGEIKKCKLYGDQRTKCETLLFNIYGVRYMTIMQAARQPQAYNPCANFCSMSSLCLLSSKGPVCVCRDGEILLPGKHCEGSQAILPQEVSPRFIENSYYVHKAKPPMSGSSTVVIAILFTVLAVCTVFASYVYLKKRKSSVMLLETMHFNNPSFGLSHVESNFHHSELTPGEHHYENPTAKLVEHPDGNFNIGILSQEKLAANRTMSRLDMPGTGSDESDTDQYDRIDMKANLIR